MYEQLFKPGQLGGLTLKNRLILSPMGTRLSVEGGYPGDNSISHYSRRAKGGVAMVTIEATNTHESGFMPRASDLSTDRYLDEYKKLTEAIHRGGALACIQLFHPGRQFNAKASGRQPVAPSALKSPVPIHDLPRELTKTEIPDLVQAFGQASARAKSAGFDAVELHGAHGYLICQFLSPWANIRQDEYGGSTENRARFATEIVHSVRRAVGPDFPIFFRISAQEYVPGGLEIGESCLIARLLVEAGVDALVPSAGTLASFDWTVQPMSKPLGVLRPLTAAIKGAVTVPVVAVGRLNRPEIAEEVLASGEADFIALGRGLLCDPEWPLKVQSGNQESIQYCVACNGCIDHTMGGEPLQCSLNPSALETPASVSSAAVLSEKKRIAVLGGGPAGMQAAWRLAERGHVVTLYEKGSELGGQVRLAAVPEWKRGYLEFIDYCQEMLRRCSVDLVLGCEPVEEKLLSAAPEILVVATGAIPFIPDIPGIGASHVVTAEAIFRGKAKAGQRVAVVGGGRMGCEVGLFLAKQGREVAILRRGTKIGNELGRTYRWVMQRELEEYQVRLCPNVRYREILAGGVLVDIPSGHQEIAADTIVVATGYQPNPPRLDLNDLISRGIIVQKIGDVISPRNIEAAVYDAANLAAKI